MRNSENDSETQPSAPEGTPWWRRRYIQWMVPVIAASIVFVFTFTRMIDRPDPPAVILSDITELHAIEPMGEIDNSPTLFSWHSSREAEFYRFELFDATSKLVFQHLTADTILMVDPSSSNAPSSGYWTVTPLNNLRSSVGGPVSTRYYTPAGVDTPRTSP